MSAPYKIKAYWDRIEEWVEIDEAWLERKAQYRYESAVESFPDLRIQLIKEIDVGPGDYLIKSHEPNGESDGRESEVQPG